MSRQCTLRIINEVECAFLGLEDSTISALKAQYALKTKNHRYHPKFKLGVWDGCINYFQATGRTYNFLIPEIVPILMRGGYKIKVEDLRSNNIIVPPPIDKDYFSHFNHFKTGKPIELRQDQVDAVNSLIAEGNGICLASTGAGKTIMTAAVCDVYGKYNLRTIVIVPDQTLIRQTRETLDSLGLDTGEYSGSEKTQHKQHVVSTWQALQHNPQVVTDFDVVLVDECLKGDTNISMSDGTYKHIKDVNPGDSVITYNQQTQLYEHGTVLKRHENLSISSPEKMYLLEFDDGTSLEVTGNHKILTTNGYVRADELECHHNIIFCDKMTRKYENLMVKYNHILKEHKQQISIVNYSKNRIIMDNGVVLNSPRDVRLFRCRLTQLSSKNLMDEIYSANCSETERAIIIKNITNKQASITNQQHWNNQPEHKKIARKHHMQTISKLVDRSKVIYPEPWSKGRTKFTDERLAKLSADRTGSGNPMFGTIMSEEKKKEKSVLLKQRIADGLWTPHVHNSRTHRQCVFNNKTYRSSWEAMYASINQDDLYEQLRIPYNFKNNNHTYIVDFINHTNKTVTEIKPAIHMLDDKVIVKMNALQEWCNINGYCLNVITEQYFIDNYNKIPFSQLTIPNFREKLGKIKYEANKKNRN